MLTTAIVDHPGTQLAPVDPRLADPLAPRLGADTEIAGNAGDRAVVPVHAHCLVDEPDDAFLQTGVPVELSDSTTGGEGYAGLRLPLPCRRFRFSPHTTARCRRPDQGSGGQEGLPC